MPILGYVFNPRSHSAMSIARAAREQCELVWIVDTTDPELGSTPRFLRRTGVVVDVAGMTVQQAAGELSELSLKGLLALADDDLVWTAEVSESLGLGFYSSDVARRLTDKFEQRSAFRGAGLATPRCWPISTRSLEADVERIGADISFPAILKPRHGAASRDTAPVSSLADVRSIVEEDPTADREWVLEEYIRDVTGETCGEGFANYVSVETIVVNGKVTPLTVTGRTPPATPFRETGLFVPAAVGDDQWSAFVAVATKAIEALGITSGCQHTEIKMTPTGPVVIEVNGRIGGGLPGMFESTTGGDLLGIAMRLALGQDVRVERPQFHNVAFHLWIQPPENMHVITEIAGLDELRAMPGVREVALNRRPGDTVDWREGNNGYVYSVQGAVEDHDGLRRVLSRISNQVHIHGE